MSARHRQSQRRLARLEESLGKRSAEPPLFLKVELEAQQELSPEELPLLESAKAARSEGRFHSLEEDAVMQKFRELEDVVARRYGFTSYARVLRQHIDSQPKPSAKQLDGIVKILNWGRDNSRHLEELREAQDASQSNSSASVDPLEPSSGMASSTPLHPPKL